MSDQAIYHILDTRRVETGLEKFAPHDLRRTFASSMLDNGEDIVTVKDAMGHSSIATTQANFAQRAKNVKLAFTACKPLF